MATAGSITLNIASTVIGASWCEYCDTTCNKVNYSIFWHYQYNTICQIKMLIYCLVIVRVLDQGFYVILENPRPIG